jgi:ketosteroid isomerase-like protein
MSEDNRAIATAYFNGWRAKDFTSLRGLLADDVTFRGPLGQADDADSCLTGLQGMAKIITDIDVHHIFVDGPDVTTWFDLHTSIAPPCLTANWSHIENGRITRIRATFDPRELLAAQPI